MEGSGVPVDNDVNIIIEKFWNWRLINAPEYATSVGCHKYDNRLDELNLNAYNRMEVEGSLLLKEAEDLQQQKRGVLSAEVQLNLSLVIADLKQLLNGLSFKAYLMPVSMLYGPQRFWPRILTIMKKENMDDINLILQRLCLFKQQIDDVISLMEEGIRLDIVVFKGLIEQLPQVILTLAGLPIEESPMFEPFMQKPHGVNEEQWKAAVLSGKEIIKSKVNPCLVKLAKYVSDKYLHHARLSISAYSLPNGKDYYAASLMFHTTTNLTPEEVHELGLQEVERITQCMEAVKKQTGFVGSLDQFKRYVNTDEQFIFKDVEEILAHYDQLSKEIYKKIPDYFLMLPKAPFIVKPVPCEIAPSFPMGYYESPTVDGSRLGTFYVNTYKPEIRKKYDALALCLHEAIPGHHLQISLTLEAGTCPEFRLYTGIKRYYQVPGYFAMNTGYLEGWGLYAEYLGEEMGLYQDPFDMFGRLSSEMLRACRLVVDTGLHAFDWSRDKAIKYMEENTSMSLHQIGAEVNRYLLVPAQACAYKIGEMKLKEIREKAEKVLGDKFDLRAFHHFVASMGSVPLDILESNVDDFINKSKS